MHQESLDAGLFQHALRPASPERVEKKLTAAQQHQLRQSALSRFFPDRLITQINRALFKGDDFTAYALTGQKNGSGTYWLGPRMAQTHRLREMKNLFFIAALKTDKSPVFFAIPMTIASDCSISLDGHTCNSMTDSKSPHWNVNFEQSDDGNWTLCLGHGTKLNATPYALADVFVRSHFRSPREAVDLGLASPRLLAAYEALRQRVAEENAACPGPLKLSLTLTHA